MHRKCRQEHAEQAREDRAAGAAEETVDATRDRQRDQNQYDADADDANQLDPVDRRVKRTREQDGCRDGAGTRNQGQGQRKDREIVHMVLDHRRLRRLLLSRLAAVKDHLEGYRKQQQAAGDAEGADGYAHCAQDRLAGDRKDGENAEGDQRAAQSRAATLK